MIFLVNFLIGLIAGVWFQRHGIDYCWDGFWALAFVLAYGFFCYDAGERGE